MQLTSGHGLPCLSNTDYGAFALYMQCMAQRIDTELGERQDALNEFMNRPAAAWVTTLVQTNISDGFFISTGLPSFYANWPGGAPPSSPTIGNKRGWWYVGANVNVIASGAVTANSQRLLTMTVGPSVDADPDEVGVTFLDATWESNTGNGENLMVAGTVYFPGTESTFTVPMAIGLTINHTNASALNTTLTPPVTVWAVYLGDTPEIEAVV